MLGLAGPIHYLAESVIPLNLIYLCLELLQLRGSANLPSTPVSNPSTVVVVQLPVNLVTSLSFLIKISAYRKLPAVSCLDKPLYDKLIYH